MVKIKEYIESGVLELYVLGSASESETKELLYLKEQHPQIREALWNLEIDMESIAQEMAIIPPPGIFTKIEAEINSLVKTSDKEYLKVNKSPVDKVSSKPRKDFQFIELEVASRQIRVHKLWIWAFAALFMLGVILFASAIYFYKKDNHTEQQIKQLRIELRNKGK